MLPTPRTRGKDRLVRLAATLATALPGVMFAACNSHCGHAKPAVEQSDAEVASVEVLDPGKEPRVPLTVGRWTGLLFTTEFTSDGSIGLVGQPAIRSPTSVMRVRFNVERGSADPVVKDGQRLVQQRAVVESLSVKSDFMPPDTVKKFNEGLAVLAGTSMRQLVGEDGAIVDVKTETVGGTEPPARVKKMLDDTWGNQRHFPFRLPPSAVGVGAHWRFSDPFERQGVRAIQVADMTLVSITEKTVTIRIRVRRSAPRQEIKNPVDPDANAVLEQYHGDGEGEVTMDRLTAVMLDARLTTTATLKVSAIGPKGDKQFLAFLSATVLHSTSHIGAEEAGVPEAGASASAAPSAAPPP